ncbi:MAG: tripartite tricarboxylate transporter substrate binding protein [Alphaproteobacteria bacterium]|nr:tripartite tricarboxylate transporter substrate binding protein [Alphaproteobacteria bacterium]
MLRKSLIGIAALTALAVTAAAPAQAAISCGTAKLIVPWGAGGGTDVIFRILVESANKHGANPQIQVVNMGGQGGNKGAKEAVKAKPDGCTLFAIHQSAISSFLTGRVDFTWDAFEPVALMTRTPTIYGANAQVPYSDLKGLVDYAKAHPGEVLAGGTLGSTSHFAMLLLEDAAGVEFKHISYDGTRERMTALLANNIQIGEINLASAKKYIQTNELKALGITTPERNAEIPDVMTVKEQGYDLVMGTDRGIMLPKGASKEVIDHYIAIFTKVANDPEVQAAMTAKGSSMPFIAGDDYRAYFEKTFAHWKKIAIKIGMYKG